MRQISQSPDCIKIHPCELCNIERSERQQAHDLHVNQDAIATVHYPNIHCANMRSEAGFSSEANDVVNGFPREAERTGKSLGATKVRLDSHEKYVTFEENLEYIPKRNSI